VKEAEVSEFTGQWEPEQILSYREDWGGQSDGYSAILHVEIKDGDKKEMVTVDYYGIISEKSSYSGPVIISVPEPGKFLA